MWYTETAISTPKCHFHEKSKMSTISIETNKNIDNMDFMKVDLLRIPKLSSVQFYP